MIKPTNRLNASLRIVSLAAVLALTGCASGVPLLDKMMPVPATVPQPEVPEGYRAIAMAEVEDAKWWYSVNSPELQKVMDLALEKNTDIRLAEQRLNEAGAILGITKSAQWPGIFAQVSQTRSRPTQSGNVPVFGTKDIYETSRAVLGVSWEIDLWGRLGNLEDASLANFQSQAYNLQGVRLSVTAVAATLYTRIRVFGMLLDIGEATLASREEALKLQRMRFDAGLTNELQYRQLEADYLTVKAQVPDLRLQLANARNALAVVLGGEQAEVPELNESKLVSTPLIFVPEALPSELLIRRPDLAAAEAQLTAAEANLAAARKAFLPSISLTGAAGSESAELSNLFSGPAKVWNVAANITQPIFQAGRLFNERDAAVAKRNQAVIAYEAAIRQAFSEVLDALVAQREALDRLQSRAEQVKSLNRLVDLAKLRVEAGVSSQLELLDAQRALLNAQLAWTQAWGAQQSALLSVIKALGGGFEKGSIDKELE